MQWTRTTVAILVVAIAGGAWLYHRSTVPEVAGPAGSAAGPAGSAGAPSGGPRAGGPRGMGGGMWNAPVPVRVVPVESGDLKLQFKTIGTAVALNTVVVQSRVSGPLLALKFTEGQKVQAGEVLAQIDPALYQVKLAQAEGQLQQNLAQLKNAEADLALYAQLKEKNSISRQQYNAQQALVNQLRGSLKSNEAQVAAAKLELSWTQIKAPISGRTGLRKVDVGNLVQANNADGLVTITQSEPIYVSFSIPEAQLQALRVAVKQAQEGGGKLAVEAWDRAEQQLLSRGELTTLDNQIDVATGTLKLKAEFANADGSLFPNQFVNVRLTIAEKTNAMTIPQDAVQYSAEGPFVYVIVDKKAEKRPLTLGVADNGRIEILKGLQAGEQVVMEGLDRLRPGREVEVLGDNPAPASDAQPKSHRPQPAQG
ncbi:MAG TPA: multidrug transporter subunit MdtA [Rheinheimera sp.]|nr:multidrug transporter subunit MdtA [Rheinheimera sp.]